MDSQPKSMPSEDGKDLNLDKKAGYKRPKKQTDHPDWKPDSPYFRDISDHRIKGIV